MAPAKVALTPVRGLIRPRQFGPMSRKRAGRAAAKISASSRAPSAPDSLKPAETIMAPRTPARARSLTTPGTVGAGVAITARSISSGIVPTAGYDLMPKTLERFGLTGKTVPPKGLVTRFQTRERPTLPSRSEAPMTATERGLKNTSRGCRRRLRMSCADSTAGWGAAGIIEDGLQFGCIRRASAVRLVEPPAQGRMATLITPSRRSPNT